MTRKEQNEILDDKIESNNNQYKIDRLNAEISAFSSRDLNKYEFLTRKDLKYKPNALDKARFEFSRLGKAFSMGLDKTAQGYQEEGVLKLLKNIRDGLRGGIGPLRAPRAPPGAGGLDGPDNDDNDNNDDNNDNNNDNDDNDDNNDDSNDMPDLETEVEASERIAKTSDNDKVFDILNKMENGISNLDKMFTDKENKGSTKLDKLNNDVKKLDNYIKENKDKKINAEKELDVVENERNNLLLKYNQLNEELNRTKNELYETKGKLNKAGNNINKKTKYIDELKEIQEKFDYQNAKVINSKAN